MNIPRLLHEASVKTETESRRDLSKQYDYAVADRMIAELNGLGYEFSYFADLQYCIITDKRAIPIFECYIPLFRETGFAIGVLPHISQKQYYECTEFLIEQYLRYEQSGKALPVVSNAFDNALVRIRDKRFIGEYCTLISGPEHRDRFYFLMELLSKWKVQEALPIIVNRLENDRQKAPAIISLGNYRDSSYSHLVEPFLSSENRYIRKVAGQALQKMCV